MPISYKSFQDKVNEREAEQLRAAMARKARSTFWITVGETALFKLNPHQGMDEPLEYPAHYVEGAKPPFVYCIEGDERFGRCPFCTNGSWPTYFYYFNIIDLRKVHYFKDAKQRYQNCLEDLTRGQSCPFCAQGNKANLRGPSIWGMSSNVAKVFLDKLDSLQTLCACGGDLVFGSWTCPECNFQGKTALPRGMESACPSCGAVIMPKVTYNCTSCKDPKSVNPADIIFRVKRSDKNSYIFDVARGKYNLAEFQFEPFDIPKTIPPVDADDYNQMVLKATGGVTTLAAKDYTARIEQGAQMPMLSPPTATYQQNSPSVLEKPTADQILRPHDPDDVIPF